MHAQTQRELIERFKKHLDEGTTDYADFALRAPASHYIEEAQAQDEIDALFRRSPLLVALSPDLPDEGSYLTHRALDTELLLIRGKDGKVRSFVNACRHRGAQLAEGRGSAKLFTCPFHAWTWNLDGFLQARPNSRGGFDDVTELCDQLIEKPSIELAGMIFVLLEGDDIAGKTKEILSDLLPELANYRFDDTVYFDSRQGERPFNYKLIIDGFCESYHLAALHKQTIAPYFYSHPSLTDRSGAVVRNIGVHKGIEQEFDKPPQDRTFLPYGTTQYIIAPNIVLCHQVDHIELWRVYPVDGASSCRFELSLYWPNPISDETNRKAQKNLDLLWNVTNTEDMPIAKQTFGNLKSGALPEIVYGKNEPGLVYYHSAIAEKIGSNRLIPSNA